MHINLGDYLENVPWEHWHQLHVLGSISVGLFTGSGGFTSRLRVISSTLEPNTVQLEFKKNQEPCGYVHVEQFLFVDYNTVT